MRSAVPRLVQRQRALQTPMRAFSASALRQNRLAQIPNDPNFDFPGLSSTKVDDSDVRALFDTVFAKKGAPGVPVVRLVTIWLGA